MTTSPPAMVALSDVGCVRERNEDCLYIDPDAGLAILADGMGGHRAGDVASQMAVRAIADSLQHTDTRDDPRKQLLRALESANQAVFEASKLHADQFGMGTTAIAILTRNGVAHIAHVGDSRAYIYDGKTLKQITEDHTYRAQIARYGDVDMIKNSTMGKMLVRAIGIDPLVEISFYNKDLPADGGLLICSDGLTDVLSDEEIQSNLHTCGFTRESAERLIRQANKKGGPDNISVILIRL